MKICAISDIHGHLINIPECDVLCIAGDVVNLLAQRDNEESDKFWSITFVNWVDKLPFMELLGQLLYIGKHGHLKIFRMNTMSIYAHMKRYRTVIYLLLMKILIIMKSLNITVLVSISIIIIVVY